jgi:hypothetical protein
VDVKGLFEGADSNLLADSNHVTSLVVTNPQANGKSTTFPGCNCLLFA